MKCYHNIHLNTDNETPEEPEDEDFLTDDVSQDDEASEIIVDDSEDVIEETETVEEEADIIV